MTDHEDGESGLHPGFANAIGKPKEEQDITLDEIDKTINMIY